MCDSRLLWRFSASRFALRRCTSVAALALHVVASALRFAALPWSISRRLHFAVSCFAQHTKRAFPLGKLRGRERRKRRCGRGRHGQNSLYRPPFKMPPFRVCPSELLFSHAFLHPFVWGAKRRAQFGENVDPLLFRRGGSTPSCRCWLPEGSPWLQHRATVARIGRFRSSTLLTDTSQWH